MRKQSVLLFAILLGFWTVLVGAVNWPLTLVGAFVALLTVWFGGIWVKTMVTTVSGLVALGLRPRPDGGVGDTSQLYRRETCCFRGHRRKPSFANGTESPYQLEGVLFATCHDYSGLSDGGC